MKDGRYFDIYMNSMRNIRMTVEYEGTGYSGWQVQNGKTADTTRTCRTVQGSIEAALTSILQEKVKLTAASRTDAGVHAAGQVANFKTNNMTVPCAKIQKALNSMLDGSIAVSAVSEAGGKFSARHDAKAKVYRYLILNRKNRLVMGRAFFWHVPYEIDWKKARNAAKIFPGKHDFSGFSSSGSPRINTNCSLKKISISREGELYSITLEADFFLYRMARNIAGFLVAAGRGKIDGKQAEKILKTGRKTANYQTAPAKGLCLMKVRY